MRLTATIGRKFWRVSPPPQSDTASMGFAGYVTVCVQLYCIVTVLHVSAYMVIFMCVGYFYFHVPEEICFAGFLPFLARGWLHVSIRIFLFCFFLSFLFFLLLVCNNNKKRQADKHTRKKQQY
jgi:hypothetical protein